MQYKLGGQSSGLARRWMSKLRLRHEADKKKICAKMEMRTLELSAGVFLFVYCRLKTDPVDRSSAVLVLSRRRLGITTTAYAREWAYIIHLFFSIMTPKVLQSGDRGSFFLSNCNNSPRHFIIHNW